MAEGKINAAYMGRTVDGGIYIVVPPGKPVPPEVASIQPGEAANILKRKLKAGGEVTLAKKWLTTLDELRTLFDLERQGRVVLTTREKLDTDWEAEKEPTQ